MLKSINISWFNLFENITFWSPFFECRSNQIYARLLVQQPYNHRSVTKSFLQRHTELTELCGRSVDHVQLFQETNANSTGKFFSPVVEDAFVILWKLLVILSVLFLSLIISQTYRVLFLQNQMLELQSQPIPEGSQPLSEDEICETVLGRWPDYSKGVGCGPTPKSRKSSASVSSSNIYDHQAHMTKVSKLKVSLENANRMIEEQCLREEERDRQIADHAWQMEEMSQPQRGSWILWSAYFSTFNLFNFAYMIF